MRTERTMSGSARLAGVCVAALLAMGSAPALGGSDYFFDTEMTGTQLGSTDDDQLQAGRKIIDIDMRWDGSQIRYSAIWAPVDGTVYGGAGLDAATWQDFLDDMEPKNGRWIDVEVGVYGGNKRWAGIFVEDGDNYGYDIRTTNTDVEFQQRMYDNLHSGRQLVDFEAYEEGGVTKFGGVWVSDPNQPRTTLYYGLTGDELSTVINGPLPVDPATGITPIGGLNGRMIDYERYYSPEHNETRYAVIFSQHPGGGNWIRTGQPLSQLDDDNDQFSDDNTHLIDLDVYESGGQVQYLALWGDARTSLNEVDAVDGDVDPEPINPTLSNLITNFEANVGNGPQGLVGFYAKNVRTNQSIGYRAGESLYMASCAKTFMHLLLWQMSEDNEINLGTDTLAYSTNSNDGNPWYVDNRDTNGSLGPNDFGNSFTLAQLDSFMMIQSDNSATTMLYEMILGRSRLNRFVAGIDGVAAGVHPMNSIADLDRAIMWQGQVEAFPTAQSYFLIPSWNWEEWFRTGGTDTFGWMQNFVGNGNPFPSVNIQDAHDRYFRMGCNSAQPRAFGRMLEKLVEGDFFDNPATTTNCMNVFLGGATTMDDILDGTVVQGGMPQLLPSQVPAVYAKNGGKGSQANNVLVVNDTVIMRKGSDDIVMVFFSMYNQRSSNTVRNTWIPQFGYQLYSDLISDLGDAGVGTHNISDATVSPKQSWSITVGVQNSRGGDATPYKVRFYASENAAISPASDYLLGTYQTPANHPGNGVANVGLNLADFPAIPHGDYYIGWIIDADNEVGEWDDTNTDNTVMLRNTSGGLRQINVSPFSTLLDPDDDLDIDLGDFAAFQACFTGAGTPVRPGCEWANLDDDARRDADLDDYILLQNCFSGPREAIDPDCVIVPQ